MKFSSIRQIKQFMKKGFILGAGLCFCFQSPLLGLFEERTETSFSSQIPFEWGTSKKMFSLESKLKERWTFSLFQECMRAKVEKTAASLGIILEISPEPGFLPCSFSGSVKESTEGASLFLLDLLKTDFLPEEEDFIFVKNLWLDWVKQQREFAQDIFARKQLLLEMDEASYDAFLETSFSVLQDLSFGDLKKAILKLEEENLWTTVDNSSVALNNKLAARSWLPEKNGWESSVEGRGGTPKSEEAKIFFQLSLTDEDKINIRKIITTMADKNVLQLLLEKRSLERRGDRIRPVHPMRFIGFVLSDPNLYRCMKSISKTSFKWNGFLEGYEKRMREERRENNLNPHVAGLADLLEVDRSVIQNYINHEDYAGLVKHFL